MAANVCIDEQNYNTMKAMKLGIWYVQIPNGYVVNPLGEVVTPKIHNGSEYVLVNRKRRAVSKITKLDKKAAIRFKEVFCD